MTTPDNTLREAVVDRIAYDYAFNNCLHQTTKNLTQLLLGEDV